MSKHHKHILEKQDAEELEKATSIFQTDERTRKTAEQYILQYRQANSQHPIKKSSAVAKCALFFAEKSQYLYDMKGQKIQGIGLSLNQIIKTYQNIDQFVLILKDFMRKVRLPDLQVQNDLQSIIQKISFSMNFYNKLDKVFKDLNFTEKVSSNSGYAKIFFSFMWLLYIDAKVYIHKDCRDPVKNTCLLATIFYSMTRYCLDYIRPAFLSDVPERINGNKQTVAKVIVRITQKLLEVFSIQNYDTYKSQVNLFDDYFETLIESRILKTTNQKIDFFSPDLITINYKRLDALYQKRLVVNGLDDRFFLKGRTMTLTPTKITPLEKNCAKTRIRNDQRIQNINPNTTTMTTTTKSFNSHRVLEYDAQKQVVMAKTNNIQNNLQHVKEVKFPKNVMFSPSMTKISIICATPISAGMEMYNYVIQKPKVMIQTLYSKQYQLYVKEWIQHFAVFRRSPNDSIQDRKTKQIHSNIVISLYKISVQSYLELHLDSNNIQQICRAFLALSIQTVCFVCNIKGVSLQTIIGSLNLNILVFYEANEHFSHFDKLMPSQLRFHFIDIQNRLITHLLWRNYECIELLSLVSSNDIKNQLGDKILKRILQYASDELQALSIAIKISQKLGQQVFMIFKSLVCFQTFTLGNRYLDQILVCCMYSVCKQHKMDIKFNDIKIKYEQINPGNKSQHQEIMCDVYIDEGSRGDIIKFYNGIFISAVKVYVKQIAGISFDDCHSLLNLKLAEVEKKQNVSRLKSKTNIIKQSQISSSFRNARRVVKYEQDVKNGLNHIDEKEQEDEVRSPRNERKLIRISSNGSVNSKTIKAQPL